MTTAKLPRGRRSGVATVAALVVLAACTLAAVAAVQIHAGRDTTVLGRVSSVARWLRTHDWTDTAVLIAAVVCAVLGLLLLVVGLLPARRALVRLADFDEHTIAGITHGSLVRDLGSVASAVDGVASAKVRVGRSRIVVRVRSALRDRSGLPETVGGRVQQRLDELAPAHGYELRVRVASGGDA